jgi:hypothetical protein
MNLKNENWLRIFFALSACLWMPYLLAHYYSLETNTTYSIGEWDFGPLESSLAIVLFLLLTAMNLYSVSFHSLRFASAIASGVLHLTTSFIHLSRLLVPFKYELFSQEWSQPSSFRQLIITLPFGILCVGIAILLSRKEVNT